jgi:ABC-2 type transport system permease protein
LSSLSFSALGLLIASRAQTMEGVSGLMNLVMLPMWIFSGVFFSASRFPDAIQPFIQALPLTAVLDALRANILRGAGWQAVAPELGIIAAWMVGSFVLALKLFRWR